MAKSRPLVTDFIEHISVTAFDEHWREITDLVGDRHGIYALYKNKRLYYVGLARNLRRRVRQHRADKHRGRWDQFSLYLIRYVAHIKEIESLLLHIADPEGNRQRGRFVKARNMGRALKKDIWARQREKVEGLFIDPTGRGTIRTPRGRGKGRAGSNGRAGGKRVYATRADSLATLIKIAGGKTIYASRGGRTWTARVDRKGRVIFRGRKYGSLSAAGVAASGRTVNGWAFWRVRRDGALVTLSSLRVPVRVGRRRSKSGNRD